MSFYSCTHWTLCTCRLKFEIGTNGWIKGRGSSMHAAFQRLAAKWFPMLVCLIREWHRILCFFFTYHAGHANQLPAYDFYSVYACSKIALCWYVTVILHLHPCCRATVVNQPWRNHGSSGLLLHLRVIGESMGCSSFSSTCQRFLCYVYSSVHSSCYVWFNLQLTTSLWCLCCIHNCLISCPV
jgi:hypothetical protein